MLGRGCLYAHQTFADLGNQLRALWIALFDGWITSLATGGSALPWEDGLKKDWQ